MAEDVVTASTALSIEELGRLIAAKRGGRGVRAAAMDVGVSPATLSRVENGHMPDLETFAKICRWLGRDPREFLGLDAEQNSTPISGRLSDDIVAELDRWLGVYDFAGLIDVAVIQRARDEIVALREALDESMKLQRHYALSLNDYDGGRRIAFESRKAWMDRLRALKDKGP